MELCIGKHSFFFCVFFSKILLKSFVKKSVVLRKYFSKVYSLRNRLLCHVSCLNLRSIMLQIGFTASLFTCFGERKASIILIILLFFVLIEIFCQNQKIPFQEKTEISVIYQQDSKDCGAVYVGETKKTLNIRTNEHISAVKSASQRSHTAEHCWKYNHDFDWNNKRELDFEKKWKTRIIKEAIYSEENKHCINGISFKLPAIWKLIPQKNTKLQLPKIHRYQIQVQICPQRKPTNQQ